MKPVTLRSLWEFERPFDLKQIERIAIWNFIGKGKKMMDIIPTQTEQDRALLMASVMEAADLHSVIYALSENLDHGIDYYSLRMSKFAGIWSIELSAADKPICEGHGPTLVTAITAMLPYVDCSFFAGPK